MLQNKPRKGAAWLPSQVVYGVDCSDPDPDKWKPFGIEAETEAAKHVRSSPAPTPKPAG